MLGGSRQARSRFEVVSLVLIDWTRAFMSCTSFSLFGVLEPAESGFFSTFWSHTKSQANSLSLFFPSSVSLILVSFLAIADFKGTRRCLDFEAFD